MTTNNHRRYNPLLDEWVIVAANRVNRPWNGANAGTGHGFEKNEMNALAPGGKRRNGEITPNYLTTFVFDNDFPSFTHFDGEDNVSVDSDPLFCQQEIRGICRVICYHPDTNKTMATMNVEEIVNIIHVWIEQFNQLKHKYKWIQIFENRGSAVGCSNSHPHGQLWAGDFLPNLPKKKDKCQRGFYEKTGRPLLVEYLEKEIIKKERIILHNEYWTVLVPFWAFWPYETMILPNRHVKRMDELTEVEQMSLADILRRLIIKYDNIFQVPLHVLDNCTFPFSMGWLGAPTGDFLTMDNLHWQLHASFYPPLLRSATVPKYMAGYEVFAESQRDITPEMAASTIRNQSDILLKFEEFGSNVV